jgi:hypothetical protein
VFWQVDATFDVVPSSFRQLLTIHAPLDGEEDAPIVPCAYILMSSKTSFLYKKIFRFIRRQIVEDPQFIFCDFEIGLINSLKKIFKNSTVKGCYVHLCRIIWRRVQVFGYKKKYLTDVGFNKKIKLIGAMAYLHPEHIVTVFDDVKKKLKSAPEVIDWFGKNYIGMCL